MFTMITKKWVDKKKSFQATAMGLCQQGLPWQPHVELVLTTDGRVEADIGTDSFWSNAADKDRLFWRISKEAGKKTNCETTHTQINPKYYAFKDKLSPPAQGQTLHLNIQFFTQCMDDL